MSQRRSRAAGGNDHAGEVHPAQPVKLAFESVAVVSHGRNEVGGALSFDCCDVFKPSRRVVATREGAEDRDEVCEQERSLLGDVGDNLREHVGQVAEGADGGEGWDLVGVRFSFVAVINSHRHHRHF